MVGGRTRGSGTARGGTAHRRRLHLAARGRGTRAGLGGRRHGAAGRWRGVRAAGVRRWYPDRARGADPHADHGRCPRWGAPRGRRVPYVTGGARALGRWTVRGRGRGTGVVGAARGSLCQALVAHALRSRRCGAHDHRVARFDECRGRLDRGDGARWAESLGPRAGPRFLGRGDSALVAAARAGPDQSVARPRPARHADWRVAPTGAHGPACRGGRGGGARDRGGAAHRALERVIIVRSGELLRGHGRAAHVKRGRTADDDRARAGRAVTGVAHVVPGAVAVDRGGGRDSRGVGRTVSAARSGAWYRTAGGRRGIRALDRVAARPRPRWGVDPAGGRGRGAGGARAAARPAVERGADARAADRRLRPDALGGTGRMARVVSGPVGRGHWRPGAHASRPRASRGGRRGCWSWRGHPDLGGDGGRPDGTRTA